MSRAALWKLLGTLVESLAQPPAHTSAHKELEQAARAVIEAKKRGDIIALSAVGRIALARLDQVSDA